MLAELAAELYDVDTRRQTAERELAVAGAELESERRARTELERRSRTLPEAAGARARTAATRERVIRFGGRLRIPPRASSARCGAGAAVRPADCQRASRPRPEAS